MKKIINTIIYASLLPLFPLAFAEDSIDCQEGVKIARENLDTLSKELENANDKKKQYDEVKKELKDADKTIDRLTKNLKDKTLTARNLQTKLKDMEKKDSKKMSELQNSIKNYTDKTLSIIKEQLTPKVINLEINTSDLANGSIAPHFIPTIIKNARDDLFDINNNLQSIKMNLNEIA